MFVRANVTLGRPGAADDEIAAALDAAQCTDFVDALPDGLGTVIGEGGASLSGGQRQRLSIARALLKDTPVVVLDEAVAAVDPETEARIQAALSNLMAGRAVIVVAHRLSTVAGADQIVVLDQGDAGRGRHLRRAARHQPHQPAPLVHSHRTPVDGELTGPHAV